MRRALARGVDAIVVAHLFGYPADVERVKDLAARHGVVVIEDAAQAAGGTLHRARLGSLADISVLSFGRGKGTTAGSGGALLVRTGMLADWARKTRETLPASPRGGRQVVNLVAQWVLSRPDLYRFPASIPALRLGEMVYHRAGTPREMTAAAAAILPAALRTADREVARRRWPARATSILSSPFPVVSRVIFDLPASTTSVTLPRVPHWEQCVAIPLPWTNIRPYICISCLVKKQNRERFFCAIGFSHCRLTHASRELISRGWQAGSRCRLPFRRALIQHTEEFDVGSRWTD